jgi:hypothetical protein
MKLPLVFQSEDEGAKPAAKLQKILSKDNGYLIGNFKLSLGEYTKSDQEVVNHLIESHFPGCEPTSDETAPSLEPVEPPNEGDWLEATRIIKWAIEGFGPFKTADDDGIFSALLKNGIGILIDENLYCLVFGYIPKPWRKVKVIFIPKPSRNTYDLAETFRPISLTSFSLKTIESIIDQHIRSGPLKRFPLHQKSKSCETAVTVLHLTMESTHFVDI